MSFIRQFNQAEEKKRNSLAPTESVRLNNTKAKRRNKMDCFSKKP